MEWTKVRGNKIWMLSFKDGVVTSQKQSVFCESSGVVSSLTEDGRPFLKSLLRSFLLDNETFDLPSSKSWFGCLEVLVK